MKKSIPEIPSPIFYKGQLYLVRNGGILAAVNSNDGSMIYDERLGAPGQYSASPVIANEHIYLVSNKGVVSVVKSGAQFELVDQHDLEEAGFVTPAIDRNSLYVRTESRLIAFRDVAPSRQ